ncbi:MAG: hypothetical protein OXH96_22490 [Spirochaetaceae bacterium]|nr:hypothetical protein [Spirochaetaceae bacterium]
MNFVDNPFDEIAPDLYVATLSRVAHSDGLHPAEQEILEQHALQFGVDLDSLPEVPEDLSDLPWATRILVYRDVYMLALADGSASAAEEEYLLELAESMALPPETTEAIRGWARDYGILLERFEELLNSVPAVT